MAISIMELNGSHIGRRVQITWRYPSWSKTRPDSVRRFTVQEVHHYAKGDTKIDWSSRRFPYTATIEFLEDE